ncbi:zf-HC2 domain-containing protein [Embleya sp. NBC_00888]|uniref:zf-HC2 domain-containing protein n=1 Tax=Embleya sp. NBC_00888 TaxID=2975960 RepID=UPI003865E46B|nr:zf-HC2 domain-containing protein [Embleya sp. NBC_00888]
MTDTGDESAAASGAAPDAHPPKPAGPPARLGCAVARLDLGAFVVGALDENEAARVRQHVATCPRCRAEYEELAGLPTLLARLTAAEAAASGAAANGVVPARVLSTAARQADRRRRSRHAVAAAAAVLMILAGFTGWVLGDSSDSGDTAGAPPTTAPPGRPSATAGPAGTATPPGLPGLRIARGGDPRSGMGAELRYAATAWGSSVDLSLSGIRPGTRCRLDVYGTRGRVETASSWVVPNGDYGPGDPIRGATSIPVGEITRFAVKTVGDGAELLEIPPAQP